MTIYSQYIINRPHSSFAAYIYATIRQIFVLILIIYDLFLWLLFLLLFELMWFVFFFFTTITTTTISIIINNFIMLQFQPISSSPPPEMAQYNNNTDNNNIESGFNSDVSLRNQSGKNLFNKSIKQQKYQLRFVFFHFLEISTCNIRNYFWFIFRESFDNRFSIKRKEK